MAALTIEQQAELRRAMAARLATVPYTKPQVNAAIQALEDWWETSGRAAAGAAIEAAAPGIFTAPLKKEIGKAWLRQKAERE